MGVGFWHNLHLADDWLASQYRRAAEAIDAQMLAGKPDPSTLSVVDVQR